MLKKKLAKDKTKTPKIISFKGRQNGNAHLKSIRKANILNFGQPLNTDGRAL